MSHVALHARLQGQMCCGNGFVDLPAPCQGSQLNPAHSAAQDVYDASWTKGGYPAQSCWGCRFGADVVTRLPFHSVLDAGTGNGALVRLMRKQGACSDGLRSSGISRSARAHMKVLSGHNHVR